MAMHAPFFGRKIHIEFRHVLLCVSICTFCANVFFHKNASLLAQFNSVVNWNWFNIVLEIAWTERVWQNRQNEMKINNEHIINIFLIYFSLPINLWSIFSLNGKQKPRPSTLMLFDISALRSVHFFVWFSCNFRFYSLNCNCESYEVVVTFRYDADGCIAIKFSNDMTYIIGIACNRIVFSCAVCSFWIE